MKYFNQSGSLIWTILTVNLGMISPVWAQMISNPTNRYRELPLVPSTSEPKVAKNHKISIQKSLTQQPSSDKNYETSQILNVNDLDDVTPEHWAYEALRSLVEKYQCISGSSDFQFKGDRSITRYEFAGAIHSCLLKLERSINSAHAQIPSQEELVIIQRLQSEFHKELQELASNITDLEQSVEILQSQQFSTTTIFRGGVELNLISAFGDHKANNSRNTLSEEVDSNLTFSYRTTLGFDTSFTGKDRLRTMILAGDVNGFGSGVTGTDMTLLIGAINTQNDVKIGTLFYEFPIGDRGIVAIAPAADFPTRIFPALNPVFSISNFGAESPIYSFAFGSGAIAYYQFTDDLAAGVTYLTSSGNDVTEGIFGGQYTALTQVTYTPSDKLGLAFTYGRYYASEPIATINITGSKGSQFAQYPFGASTATSSDAFGLQLTYKLSDRLILGGWGSYFNAKAEGSPIVSNVEGLRGDHADIWSWAITASLSDWGKLGSQLSLVFGMPPKVTDNDVIDRQDPDTSLHFELSYRYPLTDRIFLTPGFLMITNPEHNADNDLLWIGLLRTSFTF